MEILNSKEIKDRFHKQLLLWRSVERVIDTKEFAEAWALTTPGERKYIGLLFDNPDVEILKTWIKYVRREDLKCLTYIELRKLASKFNIKKYTTLTKTELIVELKKKGISINGKRLTKLLAWFTRINEETPIKSRNTKTPSKNKDRGA